MKGGPTSPVVSAGPPRGARGGGGGGVGGAGPPIRSNCRSVPPRRRWAEALPPRQVASFAPGLRGLRGDPVRIGLRAHVTARRRAATGPGPPAAERQRGSVVGSDASGASRGVALPHCLGRRGRRAALAQGR